MSAPVTTGADGCPRSVTAGKQPVLPRKQRTSSVTSFPAALSRQTPSQSLLAHRLYLERAAAMTPYQLVTTPAANDSPSRLPGATATTVGQVASTLVVKVPSWFTAGAALRIARLKRAEHILVLDRQQVIGSVSAAVLAGARPHLLLDALVTRTTAAVTPETPLEAAWRLMAKEQVGCLPVVSGGLLLGVVTYRPLVRPETHLAAE
jgi:CBS domain-containing protein